GHHDGRQPGGGGDGPSLPRRHRDDGLRCRRLRRSEQHERRGRAAETGDDGRRRPVRPAGGQLQARAAPAGERGCIGGVRGADHRRRCRRGRDGRLSRRGARRAGQRESGRLMFLGVDVGTGSSKGVLVDESGTVIREARRPHQTASPRPGWFEHDAETVWWDDVVALSRELLDGMASAVTGVCCSGIGPTVLVTDAADRPLRPAILYGIDTRCAAQAEAMNERIGLDRLLERVGNPLSTQSVGPKLRWIADEVPEVWEQARRFYSAPSWLVRQLTGEYVLDRYSASASDPLYDLVLRDYWDEMWQPYERLERPRLAASTE